MLDDHVEQTITHFSMDDEPVAVGLVFDISGSMGPKLQKSRQAAAEFFRTSNPDDEFFLVEFNDQPKMVVPLTRNVEEIQNQLTWAQSKGRTALLDAIFLAMNEMKKSKKNRKALLIISDGGDNSSRYTESEVRNLVRENDVLIYAIGVFESARRAHAHHRKRRAVPDCSTTSASRPAAATCRRMSPSCPISPPRSASSCAIATCSATRPPARSRDGRYHTLQVKVVPPKGSARPAPLLPPRLLRAHAVRPASAAIALALSSEELSARTRCLFGWRLKAMTTTDAPAAEAHFPRFSSKPEVCPRRRNERSTPCLRRQHFPTVHPPRGSGPPRWGSPGRRC